MTIAVVMGVSGSGKTTVGRSIAQREDWRLVEGEIEPQLLPKQTLAEDHL